MAQTSSGNRVQCDTGPGIVPSWHLAESLEDLVEVNDVLVHSAAVDRSSCRRLTEDTWQNITEDYAVDAQPRPQQPQQARLIALAETNRGRIYKVGSGLVIGRSPTATVQIVAGDVSRQHARIESTADGGWMIVDLGSRNGTRVNGKLAVEQRLQFGDWIQIGCQASFAFTHDDDVYDQLLQAQKMDAVGQLAGGVAHDFNNLLAALRTTVDYLDRRHSMGALSAEELPTRLQDMRNVVDHAARLTRQLLGFARRGSADEQTVDLSEVCQEVVELCRRTFDPAITIESRIQPDLCVTGEATELQQVLMNLCINARDAMPAGGTIAVSLERQAETNPLSPHPCGRAVLSVMDSGVGMDRQTAARVFEPFFTTKSTDRGTGLGLAVAYGVVARHGGHIHVKSRPGKGTTFQVYVPLRDDGSPVAAQPARRRISEQVSGQPRVLFVDDDPFVRQSTERLLNLLGCEVLSTARGEQAVEIYRENAGTIDIVLLDMLMPGCGGEQTYEMLKAVDSEVRVVVTSGHVDPESVDRMIRAGAAAFLPKPFTRETLAETINAATS